MFEASQTSYQNKPTMEEILAKTDNDTVEGTLVSIRDSKNEPNVLENRLRGPSKNQNQMEDNQIEPTAESFATEFCTFGKVVADHVILKGRTVARAKDKLEYNEYQEFCRLVRLDPRSSTCRKYRLIGAEADWLQPIAAHLPGDWTTIYDVVKIGQVKAEELISLGKLHPQATAKELKAATVTEVSDDVVSNTSVADEAIGTTVEPCVFQIDASDLSDQDRLALYRELVQAVLWLGLTVTGLPDRLAETLISEREAA
jgi:hypothetical protein